MKTWVKIASAITLFILIPAFVILLIYNFRSSQSSADKEYACRIEIKKTHFASFEGAGVEIPFRIKNSGTAKWSSKGPRPCLLSYHLLDDAENTLQYDNPRFPLPQDVVPGHTFDMTAQIISPLASGKYILEFDLVREGMAWFKDYGSQTAKVFLEVRKGHWPEDEHEISLDYGRYTKFRTSLEELDRIQKLIRLTLNYNEVEFLGKTGIVSGFSAGKDYPQIWLRDANTIIPASRYYYEADYLSSWLEEHLAFQKENGSLEDWVDSAGRSDKNTTETDQEASAVQAAYQVFELMEPGWLEKPIQGQSIIQRLENALQHVLNTRFDQKLGLLKGAHTADWGDVDLVDNDIRAVDTDSNTHWTADIYDQSMFYEACLQLARMFKALEQEKNHLFWEGKAEAIKNNTNTWLWQEEKGFYLIHRHLDSLTHDFDEENMFALGGNTQAIISGLADEKQSERIIQEALARQESFKMSTLSAALLPPYPKNTFKHPMVDDPFEYQNGGQWDWFGGKLIYAMFEQGFSRLAMEKLLEILNKNWANRGFFEWDTKDGVGQGRGFFCGSAGSLSKAIYEGLFGLKLGRETVSLEPKLGKESAFGHVYLPAADKFLGFRYEFDENSNTVKMEYNSNFRQQGRVKILNPWLSSVTVRVDGQEKDFWLERKNQDEYIVLRTDFKNHVLEIRKKK